MVVLENDRGLKATLYYGQDVRKSLKGIPDGSVHMACTSPPYFGLRDYGTATWEGGDPNCDHSQAIHSQDPVPPACRQCEKCGRLCKTEWLDASTVKSSCTQCSHDTVHENVDTQGTWIGVKDSSDAQDWAAKKSRLTNLCPCGAKRVDNQIGLEETPEAYVQSLVDVFREIRRVLRDDGTLWLNLGDSYATNGCYINAWKEKDSNVGKENLHSDHVTRYKDRKAVRGGEFHIKPKDLMGIPWRVALALQQPYQVPTCVRSEKDRAWLAAMFDGEGCIGIRRFDSYREEKKQIYQDGFTPYTVVTNNDIELLDHCVSLTGLGKLSLKQKAGFVDGRGINSRRDSFGWRLDANPAIEVIQAIYPYLIAKRKQACLAYTLDTLNKYKHGHRTVPQEVQEKKSLLWELIKKCNQRETVDIPGWVVEPKPIIEPGWFLRSDIIWSKPNPLPEPVTDRPTKAHEYIFLLTKKPAYFYDSEAVKEPVVVPGGRVCGQKNDESRNDGDRVGIVRGDGETRNRRSVWSVATHPYAEAHFATWPEKLVEPMVKAGTSEKGCCPHCGAPWERVVERERVMRHELPPDDPNYRPGRYSRKSGGEDDYANGGGQAFSHSRTIGWKPTCECPQHEPVPCLVLDPFSGSATTGKVSWDLGRNYLGTDLNPDYLDLAKGRLLGVPSGVFKEPPKSQFEDLW